MIQELNQFIWYEIWVLIVSLFYVSMLYHIVFHDGLFLVIFSLLFGLVYQILTVLNLQRNPNAWHPDPNSTLAIDQSPKLHKFTIFGTILGAVFSFQTILAQSSYHMAIKVTNACSYFICSRQHHHCNCHYFFIVLDMIKFIIRTNVETYDRFYIGILNGLRNWHHNILLGTSVKSAWGHG